MKTRFIKTDILLYIFVVLQVLLWDTTRKYRPDFTIVPDVPSEMSVKAFSFGDEQFYFRTLAFGLQNAGDTFGRFTALKLYDYNKLYQWFKLLDTLDSKSNFVPSIAAYYYSQTQNTPDVKHVVKYLEEHAWLDDYNKYHKWWWLSQAVYLSNHKLKDKDWALQIAKKLAETPRNDIPIWAKQMPAFILEQKGEEEQAMGIIASILENVEKIDEGELNFMAYFVTERLKQYIDDHPELEKLKKSQAYKNTHRSK
jgi:hypothetical protein